MENSKTFNNKKILELLEKANCILTGHFKLTSGRHSNKYIEKIRLVQNPENLDKISNELVKLILQKKLDFDFIVSPAFGAITFGFLTALKLKKEFIFTQRKDGEMSIRNGFQYKKGAKTIIIEDIVTTGGSINEVYTLLKAKGFDIKGIFAIVDRSNGFKIDNLELNSLLKIEIETWEPENCPLCKKGIPITKPGSSDKPV